MSTMQAIRVAAFGAPSVLAVQHVPVPEPQANQVLVKLLAAGVNPVETYIRAGISPTKPALPYTPGADGAGIVAAVGEGVTGVSVGSRVFVTGSLTGTYAQFGLSLASDVYALPEQLSFDQGAAINIPYKTAYLAFAVFISTFIFRPIMPAAANRRPPRMDGAVGLAAIQMARARGMTVIASAGTAEGLALVLANGAHHAVNHREPGYLSHVAALTENKGVNLIVEMAGHINLTADFDVLAPYGSIALIGSRSNIDFSPRLIMAKNATVVGIMAIGFASDSERIDAWAAINAGLQNGTLKPVVAASYPLAHAADAHVEVIEHKGGSAGKITIRPWE